MAIRHCERRAEGGVEGGGEGKGGKGGGTALVVFLNMSFEYEGTSRSSMTVVGLLAAVSDYQQVYNLSSPDTEDKDSSKEKTELIGLFYTRRILRFILG